MRPPASAYRPTGAADLEGGAGQRFIDHPANWHGTFLALDISPHSPNLTAIFAQGLLGKITPPRSVDMSSIPIGIQIGVEATAVVKALAKTAMRIGGVAMSDATRRSGSDPGTEEQLVDILGRNRLDPAFMVHFRSITARSTQEAISHFMKGLVLESGAGPTVTHALAGDDPGLLSVVAQVSFLAWSHEAQSLAQALTQAIEEDLVEGGAATILGLNYVSLLGTIRACQEQTAAFSWEHHYAAVEHKINAELQSTSSSSSRPKKRRKTSGTPRSGQLKSQPLRASDRAIPYIVLRAMVRSLEAVQRFPEERVLQISCDEGIASLVVWCHYVLGISTLVLIDDKSIPFGDEPHRVTLARCRSKLDVIAVLMEPKAEKVPVFKLVGSDLDPHLHGDHRAQARGFLKTILNSRDVTDDEISHLARWLLCDCLAHFHSKNPFDPNHRVEAGSARSHSSSSWTGKVTQLVSMNHIMQGEIRSAIAFLFDTDPEDLRNMSHTVDGALRRRAGVSWPSVLSLIYAFARVKDRGTCGAFPLSLEQFEHIGPAEHALSYERGFRGFVPNPAVCFEILGRLLLGPRFTREHISKAFLVSERGWSIFFPSLEATDPEDFDCGVIHIKPGVPARDGVRKARIVDGMTDFGIGSTNTVTFTHEPEEVSFWPGVWSADLVGTSIGYEGLDAFAVMQSYDWAHNRRGCQKWRLGFREKQELCMDFWILKRCSCNADPSEETVKKSIDDLITGDINPISTYTLRFPKERSPAAETPERVLQGGNNWLFFVGGDGAARWLGADGFRYIGSRETPAFSRYIRGRRCCVRCATNFLMPPALILL
ncbi:hypothetical protein MAPG_08497 [Magnaporthiopsis poae ATCC 64411]|uniref:Uncharacterized protein n=1 Tax=Magnaporthiopsis poae (strain ATCC 64411 / 73-15) TaxID=644358 RepID=A0A0C4E7I4_MAGP6|nr:hypothetical protein MAPG_08497 [Magnaporthiopsis poae ATCC 64411]